MADTLRIRPSAVAGSFYPGDTPSLEELIRRCLETARNRLPASSPDRKRPRALVVPHAGYVYSGAVAAASFLQVPDWSRISRVHLWGAAHTRGFRGLAGAPWHRWETPLGLVDTDIPVLKRMEAAGLIFLTEDAHREEHSLEVQLPFLQYLGFRGTVVPLVFGFCSPPEEAARLEAFLDPGDLVLVSTDLSHYHTAQQAEALDGELLEKLLEGDSHAVSRGEACGRLPLETLVHLASSQGWTPGLLSYSHSGKVTRDTSRVVGYAALSYTGPDHG